MNLFDPEERAPAPPAIPQNPAASGAAPGGRSADGDVAPRFAPALRSAGAEWEAFQQVLAEVRARTGRDITRYSTQAITERVRQRMDAHGLTALRDYAMLLDADNREARLLSDAFWPPEEGFVPPAELISPEILSTLFHGKGVGDQVRVWVIGCAAGASAYSTAMLLLSYAATLPLAPALRVFASDPRGNLLRQARTAVYPPAALEQVGPEWRARYFDREPGGHRLHPEVRDAVLFAEHHVLDDAPFLQIDLILCRGYLPQLRPDLLAQVLELFHYVLRGDGFLCLGGDKVHSGDLFGPFGAPAPDGDSPPLCLRRLPRSRRAAPPALPLTWLRRPRPELLTAAVGTPADPDSSRYAAITPAEGFLVGPDQQVRYVGSRAARFLHQGAGVPSANALRFVRPELERELRAALERALDGRAFTSRSAAAPLDGALRAVRVSARPLADSGLPGYVAVEFQEEPGPSHDELCLPGEDAQPGEPPAQPDATLRLQLRRMVEEHSIALEEMSAINEELRGVNEELKATLVNLEASKRDLEASNRELALVNLAHNAHISELNRTTADLQNFLAALDIATLFLDGNLCIRRFTPRAAGIFKLADGDLGRTIGHIPHHLHYEGLAADAARVIARAEPLRAEVSCSEGHWYLMQLLPYRAHDGRVDGVVLTFVDITERKLAELALQELNAELEKRVAERTAELERSNRELDQFAYVASHDLKAPLRAITFLANWVVEDAGPLLPAESRTHLTKLTERAARMETLLNDLLTYSRAGRQRHAPATLELGQLWRDVVELVAPPPGFTIAAVGEPPELVSIRAERVPLELVLRNLVSNAVKHHHQPEQGQAWITCRDGGDHYEFTVRDDGPGIEPTYHRRVFELFERLRPRDEVEGSGLGLAVVKKTVESRGGTVDLESFPHAGSTFRFTWPKESDQ